MSQNVYEQWGEVVNKVARFVAYDFPDVEAEDLAQDLFIEIIERRLSEPERAGVSSLLTKIAKGHAQQYRAQHLTLTPQYNYRVSEVRRILENVFEYNAWHINSSMFASDDDEPLVPINTTREPSYTIDDLVVEYSDVKDAFDQLQHKDQKLIVERYVFGFEHTGAQSKAEYRAVEKLTNHLNSYRPRMYHEGPGSRQVISNEEAHYRIRRDYSAWD